MVLVVTVMILSGIVFSKSSLGIVNPAATYCQELGYQYTIEKTPKGECGVCHLPDGSTVNEWEFFKGEVGEDYSYCKQKGYEIKIVSDDRCQYSSECAVCVLKYGTEVEITELMGLELKGGIAGMEEPAPVQKKRNSLFYLVIILVVVGIIAFIIYRKNNGKNQDIRRDEMG